jgi:hypothetical protein
MAGPVLDLNIDFFRSGLARNLEHEGIPSTGLQHNRRIDLATHSVATGVLQGDCVYTHRFFAEVIEIESQKPVHRSAGARYRPSIQKPRTKFD